MNTQIHTVAKSSHVAFDLADDGVMMFVPKDGKRFAGKMHVGYEGDQLVLSYADGTSIALGNL